jgi:hypothetical protein
VGTVDALTEVFELTFGSPSGRVADGARGYPAQRCGKPLVRVNQLDASVPHWADVLAEQHGAGWTSVIYVGDGDSQLADCWCARRW